MGLSTLGIIAPHPPIMVESVGGADTLRTASSVASMLQAGESLARFAPDTVVVISPHSPAFADGFVVDTAKAYTGSLERFGAREPNLAYSGDPGFASALISTLDGVGIAVIDRASIPRLGSGLLDHGVVVPMSFLDPDGRWPLVNLSLSGLDMAAHRTLGRTIGQVADTLGRRVAFVASGDLSHRLSPDAPAGYAPSAEQFDAHVVNLVTRGDLDGLASIDEAIAHEAGECGLRSLVTLSGLIPDPRTRVLSYEAPWGVGYLTALVANSLTFDILGIGTLRSLTSPPQTPPASRKGGAPGCDGHELVSLARTAIEAYVQHGRRIVPPALTDTTLPPHAGVFVSLHAHGALRGCIGTIAPACPTLAEEVIANALSAATGDPRFPPVEPAELSELDIKIDILHEPEPCEPDDLDPSCYGIIVIDGNRQGLLLPDLEGVDDIAQQIDIARRKAGISPGVPVKYLRFRVDRYA